MFDWKKPTVQMLGRWQPWHDGHQVLFNRCVAKTGQVRDVQGVSGGDGQNDNPFDWDLVCRNIEISKQIAEENNFGLKCINGDKKIFKSHVKLLISDKSIITKMGNNSYDFLNENYNIDIFYNIIMKKF